MSTAAIVILVLVLATAASVVTLIVRGVAAGTKVDREDAARRASRRREGPLPDLRIGPLETGDRAAWEHHWNAYCDFYGEELPGQTTDTTWNRFHDPAQPMKGFGAFDAEGRLVGFAHIVLHPHTWSPRTLCYLEDLYVAPSVRGRDVGHRLITHLWRLAEDEGWGRLYWHTETTNTAARRLYDRFRPADNYVRYTLKL